MVHRILIGSLLLMGLSARAADDDYRALPDSVKAKFARADKNGDKKLSLDEFLATVTKEQAPIAKRDFGLFDQDADGQLTLEEFWSIPTVAPADQRGPLPDPMDGLVRQFIGVMDKFFKDWDQDLDRKIGRDQFLAEFTTTVSEPLTANMQREADPNGDGLISRAEAKRFVEIQFGVRRSDGKRLRDPGGRVAQHMQFQYADQNKDDRLDHDEFIGRAFAGAKAEEIWTNGDKDKDGFVSWDEWCLMPGRMFDPITEFRRIDTNLDGQLDPDELNAGTPDWIKISAKTAIPAFDLDRSGKLSLAEYRLTLHCNPVLRWHDIILDPDGDGKISRTEFVYDRTAPLLRFVYFKLLDQNGDNELDQKEFVFNLRTPRAFYSLNADGTGWKKMFAVEGYPSIGSPAVSPDGKLLAFDAHKVKETLTQQTMLITNLDGSNLRSAGYGLMPTWSADGTQLTCSRSRPQYGLWLVGLDGKNERFLRDGWGAQFSPDGKKILFSDYRTIMTYDVATEKTTNHFDGQASGYQQIQWNMTWSPDGKRVCFKGIKPNAVEEVGTVWVDGGEPRLKVHYSGKSVAADFAWHPSGDRIVYCMNCPERKVSQLYEFHPDSADPPKLVKGQDETVPISGLCWTPDGQRLIVITIARSKGRLRGTATANGSYSRCAIAARNASKFSRSIRRRPSPRRSSFPAKTPPPKSALRVGRRTANNSSWSRGIIE
jgi:Tol biopolymer transport system component/Ca2+-binding EF-hand superfamily protein